MQCVRVSAEFPLLFHSWIRKRGEEEVIDGTIQVENIIVLQVLFNLANWSLIFWAHYGNFCWSSNFYLFLLLVQLILFVCVCVCFRLLSTLNPVLKVSIWEQGKIYKKLFYIFYVQSSLYCLGNDFLKYILNMIYTISSKASRKVIY